MSNIGYGIEEKSQSVKRMSRGETDLFQKENESLDLLLKEMESDPNDIKDIAGEDPASNTTSPVRPLNYAMVKSDRLDHERAHKEFNSSSDTYTTDAESPNDVQKTLESSLERNFDLEGTGQIHKTISNVSHHDEFSFTTPTSSTADLLLTTKRSSAPASPCKSIMKKSATSSPKKSVVFTSSNPEVHHYPEPDNSLDLDTKTPSKVSENGLISHGWSKLERKLSSDDDSSTPPLPPPRTSASFATLLSTNERDELNKQTLTNMKLRSSSFNNLSLNEKLDFFLTKNENNGVDLDQHLKRLEEANQSNVENNIHDLSLNLMTPKTDIENPLDSLAKDSEVQLRSSGSSQSSLQSLVESNRKLQSDAHSIVNKGLELNNGLKGYSDEVINTAIPVTDKGEEIKRSRRNSNRASMISTNTSNGEVFHDSFDTSYNNTEQSIMKLLIPSSSQSNLENVAEGKKESETIESNGLTAENIAVKSEEDDIRVKEENEEYKYHHFEPIVGVKPDPSDEIASENNWQPAAENGLGIFSNPEIAKEEEEEGEETKTLRAFKEDDTTYHNDSAQFSLRLDMDSEWKLEDSNDGDREDNDDYTNVDADLTTNFNRDDNKPILNDLKDEEAMKLTHSRNSSALSSPEFQDASDEMDPAGPFQIKSEFDEENFAADVEAPASLNGPEKEVPISQESDSNEFDQEAENGNDNVLANSSNIAPPEEITLPPIEVNNYSSFDELTKNLNDSNNSYEESLSAEHDNVKTPVDYISIWHTQEKTRKHSGSKSPTLKATLLDTYEPSTQVLPGKLKAKKFKDVSVTSRKVVNPDFEELHVTGYLPELSDDSGFASHFQNVKFNLANVDRSNIAGNRRSETPLSVKNVLANIDNSPEIPQPPSPKQYSLRPPSGSLKKEFLRPGPPKFKAVVQKRSKFKVPSVNIQKPDSISSPMDQYNDIFEDVLGEAPTMKSHGMKTLPSMDRDDVKRILSTKRLIMQDEYSNLKYVGCETRKKSVVNEPTDHFDKLSQHASIHDISPESSPQLRDHAFSHLATELSREPDNLKSKDQVFGEDAYSEETKQYMDSFDTSLGSLANHITKNAISQKFPDPDPELYDSPSKDSNIFKTPPKTREIHNDELDKTNMHQMPQGFVKVCKTDESPSRKKHPPIKIGSPVKLVKQGASVTGIELPTTAKEDDVDHFQGSELTNNKLRGIDTKDAAERPVAPISITIPSGATNKSKISEASSNTLAYSEDKKTLGRSQASTPLSHERGRLFFRVVGLKNLNLPDVRSHQGQFSLTLDNGVHCIKTPYYNIEEETIPIGKEFELLVGDSLEFIMTLKMNYDKPKDSLKEVREKKVVKSKHRLSRLFGTKDVITSTKFVPIEASDSWKNKFAQDGSFGRCYVDLAQYENSITGNISTYNLNCFNEWETALGPNNEVIRYRPYNIGQLEVKMLFVPRTSSRELLPNSIKSAQESISELQQEANLYHEGYLDQEGGDCETKRRRFFKLYGTSLIAHSEFSHKTRAKINLTKVVDIIYIDKENYSSKNYRNFSDVILLENSFKIRFANGEVIDFLAPNNDEKLRWISIVQNIIRRNKFRRLPWVNLMLEQSTSK